MARKNVLSSLSFPTHLGNVQDWDQLEALGHHAYVFGEFYMCDGECDECECAHAYLYVYVHVLDLLTRYFPFFISLLQAICGYKQHVPFC